ncbi:MAG: hypothetical protein ACRDP8_09930 [Actinopolymorphaceae bacterium]
MRERRKSPYPGIQDPTYELALRERVAGVVADEGPAAALLNPKRVLDLLDSPLAPSNFAPSPRALEQVLNLAEWLGRNPVRLALS